MEKPELGLHFYPSDIELLLLLKKKDEGEQHPSDFVVERDMYGPNATPWEIFEDTDPWEENILDQENKEKKVLHVFTKLCNLSAKKIARTAGCGTWSGQAKGKEITSKKGKKGEILGFKKSFTFVVKRGFQSEVQGHWTMYEYSLAKTKTDYVICKVIRSDPKSSQEESAAVLDDEDGKNLEEETARLSKKLKHQTSTSAVTAATANFAVESTTGVMQWPNLPNLDNIWEGSMANYQDFQDPFTGGMVMDGRNDEEPLETIGWASGDTNMMPDYYFPHAESNQNASASSIVTEQEPQKLQNPVDYGEEMIINQETKTGSDMVAEKEDSPQNTSTNLDSTLCGSPTAVYLYLQSYEEQQLEQSFYQHLWEN